MKMYYFNRECAKHGCAAISFFGANLFVSYHAVKRQVESGFGGCCAVHLITENQYHALTSPEAVQSPEAGRQAATLSIARPGRTPETDNKVSGSPNLTT